MNWAFHVTQKNILQDTSFPRLGLSPCLTALPSLPIVHLLLCKGSCVKVVPGAGVAQGKALGRASAPCQAPVHPAHMTCRGDLLFAKCLHISFMVIFPHLLTPSECHMWLFSPKGVDV